MRPRRTSTGIEVQMTADEFVNIEKLCMALGTDIAEMFRGM